MVAEPQAIPVGREPPPLRHAPNGRAPASAGHQGQRKPKGKTGRRKTGDRFAVLKAFVDFTLAGLTRIELAVWLVRYRDTKPNGTAQTSQADLARRAGTSDRTIRRALERLEAAGLLKAVYLGGFRRGLSRYRVCALKTGGA